MAATVMFYHLIRHGLEETVVSTLTRARANGWRVMVRAPDVEMLDHLDARLWLLGPEEEFMAHGLQGGAQDAMQPILLGPGAVTNAARGLMLLAGAEASEAEMAGLERVWVLFDGADPQAVAIARQRWKTFTGWGLAAQYWSDESGPWAQKS